MAYASAYGTVRPRRNAVVQERLGTTGIARLLGVSRPRVWQLRRQPGFPEPLGEEGGREYWSQSAILRWAAQAGRDLARRTPLLYRPAASDQPAHYLGARVVKGHVVLSWDAAIGQVAVFYPLVNVGERMPARLGALVPGAAVLVVIRSDYDVGGPRLKAVDSDNPERPYHVYWTDLARALGMPVPWWPVTLRKPDEMLRWAPGRTPIVTQATSDLDPGPLLRLAAGEPEDSSSQRVLLHMARAMQRQDTEAAQQDLELVEKAADRDAITVAATPLLLSQPFEEELAEVVRRDGWARVLQREDQLAMDCVRLALMWDGGADFPFASHVPIDPTTDPVGAEWAAALVPTARTAEYTVFDLTGDFTEQLLRDPATDLPVVRDEDGQLEAAIPQRLPAVTPLAAVLLRGEVAWIRTEDGQLYIAPRTASAGWSWGYRGTGPWTFATLLDRLLDDINAPAPDVGATDKPPEGLFAAAQRWTTGDTLTRADLLAARRNP
jgi:predicted DNA-binding transcriptional regulator AlpA